MTRSRAPVRAINSTSRRCGYRLTRKKVSSAASLARSNSCHAPPSGSAQRWPYHAGASGQRRNRREIGNVAEAEHALHDDADVHVARPRPEQDEPALSARAVRHDRFAPEESGEIHDAVEIAANVGEAEKPGLRQRHRGERRHGHDFGGIREPDAASARPTQLKPSRDDSTCAVVLLARRVASSCWNNRRSIRAGRAIASGRVELAISRAR